MVTASSGTRIPIRRILPSRDCNVNNQRVCYDRHDLHHVRYGLSLHPNLALMLALDPMFILCSAGKSCHITVSLFMASKGIRIELGASKPALIEIEGSLMADKSQHPMNHADVVVVGGGGSGLAAAIEARSLGRRVILIEKNARLGGSTARSVGSISATNTPHQLRKGIFDCPDHHFEDVGKFGAYLGVPDNLAHRRLLVDNVPETIRWLMKMGVEFFGPIGEPPHRKPRMHNVIPNSRAYIYHLSKHARAIGVDIRTEVRARQLIVEAGRVVGVRCDTSNGPAEFRAGGGVVLSTGDFAGSEEMRAKYISPEVARAQIVNPTNTGDGHQMALDLGSRIVSSHLYHAGVRFKAPPESWVTALPPYRFLARLMNIAMETLPGWFLRPFMLSFLTTILAPEPKLFTAGALVVNRDGKRFSDELTDAAAKLVEQPGQFGYILLDGRLVEQFSKWPNFISSAPGVAWVYVQDYRRTRKDLYHSGKTLSDLARSIGAAPQNLEQAINEYNAALEKSQDQRRPPFGAGPYVALGPVHYYVTFSDSGIATNDNLQVMGPQDKPIPGLYACGFVGMGGVVLEGHGHHLGWAFTSGRFAGRHAAYGAVTQDLPGAAGTTHAAAAS
jgi:succinate dehydrogenase/fumarate reductase flavoprotein subunit